MAPNVWIVLVDYNGLEDTRKCLRSLTGQSSAAQTIVVDNASQVDVTEALKAEFPWAHLIRSTTNGGWAGGNNIGMKYAMKQGADLVILLNNDTVVDPEFVTRLVAAANAYPEFGIIGPVIRFMDPPHEVQTDGVQFNRPDKPGFFQRQEIKLTTAIPPKVMEVDIVNGCCLMVSRKVVEAIGYVDEEFFLIHEESDFCLRSQVAGFKNGVLAEALVWHKGSSTFKREGSRLQRYYDARNLVRLIHKHGHRSGSRGTWRSYAHHLRYSYHRYAIERDGNFTDSANAVLEGLYDAAWGHWGPYRKSVRPGLGVLRGILSLVWKLVSKPPVTTPIAHPQAIPIGPPPPS